MFGIDSDYDHYLESTASQLTVVKVEASHESALKTRMEETFPSLNFTPDRDAIIILHLGFYYTSNEHKYSLVELLVKTNTVNASYDNYSVHVLRNYPLLSSSNISSVPLSIKANFNNKVNGVVVAFVTDASFMVFGAEPTVNVDNPRATYGIYASGDSYKMKKVKLHPS